MKSKTKRKGFSPFSLDAVNFLSADVRGAVGPFLNVHITIPAPAALGGAFPGRHERIKFPAFVDRHATEAAEARDQFLKIGRRAAGLK